MPKREEGKDREEGAREERERREEGRETVPKTSRRRQKKRKWKKVLGNRGRVGKEGLEREKGWNKRSGL